METFKLWLETQIESPIIIFKKNEYDGDPFIIIQFPSGDKWKYSFQNQFTMEEYLYRYGRNIGRLANHLKKDQSVTKIKSSN